MAGWVAPLEQWLRLEDGWVRTLKEFNIASGVFHRTDFQATEGEYTDLSCRNRERLLYKLISHIITRVRFGFCTVIPMKDYKNVNEQFYLEEALGKPYALAGAMTAVQIEAGKNKVRRDSQSLLFLRTVLNTKAILKMYSFSMDLIDPPLVRKKILSHCRRRTCWRGNVSTRSTVTKLLSPSISYSESRLSMGLHLGMILSKPALQEFRDVNQGKD